MTILLYIGIGLAVGSISGIFGIGGGILVVPALIWLCGFDAKRAAGTSLAVLAMPITLPSALFAYRRGYVELDAALWVAGAFLVGALAIRPLVEYTPEAWLRPLFGLIMIYVGVRFVVSTNSDAINAAMGLVGVVLACLTFLGLRRLGKRYLAPAELGAQIRRMQEEGHGSPDYHI
jgi:uncharacterized membrane protein YfcA